LGEKARNFHKRVRPHRPQIFARRLGLRGSCFPKDAAAFHLGGAARAVVKGKRRLLLSRWLNLNTQKRRRRNALFALNRRVMKAYLLKESLDRLWSYRYEGAIFLYLRSWIDQLRWQRLKPMEKLADMLLNHLEGVLNYCRTKVRPGGGGGQRQYQSAAAPGTRLPQPKLPAAKSPISSVTTSWFH